jgi:hypothetical protein
MSQSHGNTLDSDSDSSGSDDEGPNVLGSTDVLGKLLRDASALTPARGKNRKLQPEVVNIQRMKHIANSGPVSNLFQTKTFTDKRVYNITSSIP